MDIEFQYSGLNYPPTLLKYAGASLDELAFGLLHAASNPGSNASPLTSEDAAPFLEFLYNQGKVA